MDGISVLAQNGNPFASIRGRNAKKPEKPEKQKSPLDNLNQKQAAEPSRPQFNPAIFLRRDLESLILDPLYNQKNHTFSNMTTNNNTICGKRTVELANDESLAFSDQIMINYSDSEESTGINGINAVYLLKKDRNDFVEWSAESKSMLDNHPDLKWWMLIKVRGWVSGVCEDLSFKRETFYSAISLLDRYLLKALNFCKENLQLMATACLYISTKLKENSQTQVNINVFAQLLSNAYSFSDIREYELQISKKLSWKLNLSNLNSFANILTVLWDSFMDSTASIDKVSVNFRGVTSSSLYNDDDFGNLISFRKSCKDSGFFFRKRGQVSYKLYRELYTILDKLLLIQGHYAHDPIGLVLCALHLVIDKRFLPTDLVSFGSVGQKSEKHSPEKQWTQLPEKNSTGKDVPQSPLKQYHNESLLNKINYNSEKLASLQKGKAPLVPFPKINIHINGVALEGGPDDSDSSKDSEVSFPQFKYTSLSPTPDQKALCVFNNLGGKEKYGFGKLKRLSSHQLMLPDEKKTRQAWNDQDKNSDNLEVTDSEASVNFC
jgi:hypothetical protein